MPWSLTWGWLNERGRARHRTDWLTPNLLFLQGGSGGSIPASGPLAPQFRHQPRKVLNLDCQEHPVQGLNGRMPPHIVGNAWHRFLREDRNGSHTLSFSKATPRGLRWDPLH